MTVAAKAQQALDMKKLDLPDKPQVAAIEVEDYVDWAGDEALRVYVILKDDTRDEELTGDSVIQLKSAIRDRLLSQGIREFPYIRLFSESVRRPEQIQE
jgi:hypothetical protein